MKHIVLYLVLLFGLFMFIDAQNATSCTVNDYAAQYSQCRSDGTHDLLWYKKQGVNCTGGVDSPPSVFDLPCSITCSDGEYLPLGSTECAPCQPGTYSRGGGQTVNYWPSLITDIGTFTTYCENYTYPIYTLSNCPGWFPSGTFIKSGKITNAQSSYLQLVVQLLVAGHLQFSYRVDAEVGWDGLKFYLDGNMLLPLTSLTNGFVDFDVNVTSGLHTFIWEYYKDPSDSAGEDAAFISSIEIAGLTYAESACTPCAPGTYSSNNSSVQCLPCPLNSIASNASASTCDPCPSNQFAYQSSTLCSTRVPCTTNDYQILNGTCVNHQLLATAYWLDPTICDNSSLPLPAPQQLSCQTTCPEGTVLDNTLSCEPCPVGTYVSQGTCATCPAGNYALRVVELGPFDSWEPFETTYCTGDCGTNGWRLRSDFIDSGSGHGGVVNSVLELNVTLETVGQIAIVYSFYCINECQLALIDYPFSPSTTFPQSSYGSFSTFTLPMLPPGVHSFTITFSQDTYIAPGQPRNDSARIYAIVIDGSANGGAETCSSCPDGTFTSSPSSLCSNCSAGSTSSSDHSSCISCSGNTYSAVQGDICHACGPATTANPTHTDCSNNCTFYLGSDLYDLTSIAKNGPIGPVNGGEYNYYFNLCGRGDFPSVCDDQYGNPLNTHVCQTEPAGYSIDAGWLPGYYALDPGSNPTALDLGFRVSYEFGTLGCGPVTGGSNYPRSTNLTFLCDPTAGVGAAVGLGAIEYPPCNYNFVWSSLYACPVCSSAHYSFYYTPCNGGSRQQVYYWNDPILCHDGVTLPAAESVTCSDSTFVCGIGTMLGSDGQSCVPCPDGEYSVGGGLLISNWPIGSSGSLPNGYLALCDTLPCTSWVSDDGVSIHSGVGDSSLSGDQSFSQYGNVSFSLKVYSTVDGFFQFYIDGGLVFQTSVGENLFDWYPLSFSVNPGTHNFRWSFVNGLRYSPTLLTFQGVTIQNILLTGLDYHADACSPCPEGTYSNATTSVNAATTIGCVSCPPNTYSIDQTECIACPSNTYSFAGSSYCQPKGPCSAFLNYELKYTPCGATGTRTGSWVKVAPDTCAGGYSPPRGSQTVPCAPCPASTVRVGAECVGCPLGQFFSTELASCVDNVAGYLVQYVAQYFIDNSTFTLPPGFTTGCSGQCGTNGWRPRGAFLDAGYHGNNTVDSYLTLDVNLTLDGSISFRYFVFSNTTGSSDGFQVLVDGVVQAIPAASGIAEVDVLLSLPAGSHSILWNYHQENTWGLSLLRNIQIVGAAGASATLDQLLPCPPGQYSDDANATQCSICGPGSFSGSPGSTACAVCGESTYTANFGQDECLACGLGSYTSDKGSTQCVTDCVYNIAGSAYDLTQTGVVSVYDNLRQLYYINVCDVVGDQCPDSHVCVESVDGTFNEIGDSFRLAPFNTSSKRASPISPFSIYFEHGSSVGCPDGVQSSTVIQFQCDPTAAAGAPVFIAQTDCTYTFSWQTTYACPVCTDSDYQTVTGVCSGGKRQISKTRVSQCNGPLTEPVPDEGCSAAEFPTGAVVAVVIVFVVVVAVAAFIVWRNRVMAQRYNQLVEETRSQSGAL